MAKRYFDAIVIVPLNEEFEACVTEFEVYENLSCGEHLYLAARLANTAIDLLLTQQGDMGKTEAMRTCASALQQFDCGLIVCVGIAGGISKDLNIGDICYSGNIVDVLDNAKISDKDSKTTISLSGEHYDTPRRISNILRLNRLLPATRGQFTEWQERRYAAASLLINGDFHGKEGKRERIQPPKAQDGLIACGSVSGSTEYNAAIKGVDRRVLAVETESGGIFECARQHKIPALTIRGISDYAGIDKTQFEAETNNSARRIAAENAMSFLASQIVTAEMRTFFDDARAASSFVDQLPLVSPPPASGTSLLNTLDQQKEVIDSRLRELAAGYELLQKGYRLPVPRIRLLARAGFEENAPGHPVEIRDALRQARILTISLPKEYPDHSLSWIIALDLLTADLNGRALVPSVIEAKSLQRPRTGILELLDPCVTCFEAGEASECVYIVDNFTFDKKTRVDFLREQIAAHPTATFIIVTRSDDNVLLESRFASDVGAQDSRLCDVSFSEISFFVQKNYEMTPQAAEVIAARLTDLFENFQMPVHPAYFAGIPKTLLSDLLRANRRAELIELAVAGYLSFAVAEDKEPIALSRKTRERFLTEIAYEINIEKRALTESDLVIRAERMAAEMDFAIRPAALVASFSENGIIHYDAGRAAFTLNFIESFLLAKRLKQDITAAENYFLLDGAQFDHQTFMLYAEMGVPAGIVDLLDVFLDENIQGLNRGYERLLTSDELQPSSIMRPDRLSSIQRGLETAVKDVRDDKELTREKQRMLDAAERAREGVAEKRAAESEGDGEERQSLEARCMNAWNITSSLLGSGAESLTAETKRNLAKKLVKLTTLIIEDWTRQAASIDMSELKNEMLGDEEFINRLKFGDKKSEQRDVERLVDGLVDALEFVNLSEPFRVMMDRLCEDARDKVLAQSVANITLDDDLEQLVRNLWLAELETSRGKSPLENSIRDLKSARLLRVCIAHHLVNRVFWQIWEKQDRLTLLEVANSALKITGRTIDPEKIGKLADEAMAAAKELQ